MNIHLLISAILGQQCSRIYARKEIRDLTSGEIRNLTTTLSMVYKQGYITTLTQIHNEWASSIHGNSIFLPWHRQFINELQKIVFYFNPHVIIPYWNWSQDAENAELSPIFSPQMFGGNGNPTGLMNNTLLAYPYTHYLERQFSEGYRVGKLGTRWEIDQIRQQPGFSEFASQTEFIHGYVHAGIGGDMFSQYSSNDPLFFLHHFYVDKQWSDWQLTHPQTNTYYSSQNPQASLNDLLAPYNVRVRDVMDTLKYPFCSYYLQPEVRNSAVRLQNFNRGKANLKAKGKSKIRERHEAFLKRNNWSQQMVDNIRRNIGR